MELEINRHTKIFSVVVKNKNKGFTLTPKNFGVTLRSKGGFTLIEMLVALTVFSILIISVTTVATSIIKSQREAFALQNIHEPARYILESMSKEIRMSQEITLPAISGYLEIKNADGQFITYQFINNKLYRYPSSESPSDNYLLSPADLELTGSFCIDKSAFPNRAIVTVSMKIKSTETKAEKKAEVYLQSTISQRSY